MRKVFIPLCLFIFLIGFPTYHANALKKGDIDYMALKNVFTNKDGTGNKMNTANWTWVRYFSDTYTAGSNLPMPILVSPFAGPSMDITFNGPKINQLLTDAVKLNQTNALTVNPWYTKNKAPKKFPRLDPTTSEQELMWFRLQDYSSVKVYHGTTLFAEKTDPAHGAAGIQFDDIEFKANGEIWGYMTMSSGNGLGANIKIYGLQRIDNKRIVTTGGHSILDFYVKTSPTITGEISTDKTTVKPGDKVNVNWETKK